MGSIDFGSNYAMDDLYVGFIALSNLLNNWNLFC